MGGVVAMKIAVYCGASVGNNENFTLAAKKLATWITQNGHTLVYGGGKAGLMGVIADEVLHLGGEVIGVIPIFLADRELSHPNIQQLEVVESMTERKNRIIELADVFIALPGGPGTLEEIAEVISWARIARHDKPCILMNIDGYYKPLQAFFEQMVDYEFLGKDDMKIMLFTDSLHEIKQYVESYEPIAARKYR